MVGLNGLRGYQSNQDPHALLIDEQQTMYPLAINEEVRTSVVVKQRADGHWEAAEFGHMNLVKAAHARRRDVSVRRQVTEADLSLIEIPTLGAVFLGHDEKGAMMLTPVYDVPGTTLRSGETHRASEVFETLRPLAAQIDPNMPS